MSNPSTWTYFCYFLFISIPYPPTGGCCCRRVAHYIYSCLLAMSQVASADDNSTGAAPAATPVATVVAPSNRNMSNAEANYVSHAPAAAPVATVVAPSNKNMSNAEANYVSHGNDKRKLIVMTNGLETEIDADSSPWNNIPRREIKPRNKDFQD